MAQTIVHHHTTYEASPAGTLARIVWAVTGIIETLLAVRFLFDLLGANPATPFVNFIQSLSQPVVAPFSNIFRSVSMASGGVWNWSVMIAMVVYLFVAWAIVELVAGNAAEDHTDYIERV